MNNLKIGEKTLKAGGDIITSAMLTHIEKINRAYLNAGEKDFKISLGLTINPGPAAGNHKLKADISFNLEKISDTFSISVDEIQTSLFEEKEKTYPCYLWEEGGEVFEKVCRKCDHRLDVIFVDGENLPRIIPKDEDVPTPDPEKGQMIQYQSCPAWADRDYKLWMDAISSGKSNGEVKTELNKLADELANIENRDDLFKSQVLKTFTDTMLKNMTRSNSPRVNML
jgi:hypothetical protein